MYYQQYVARKDKRNKNINLIKNIVIATLSIVVVLLLGVVLNLKRAYNLREYAIANNCEWTYMNTAYGDDRDFICK